MLATIIEGMVLASVGVYFMLLGHGIIGKRIEFDPIKADKIEKSRKVMRITGPIIIVLSIILTIHQLANPAGR